MKKMYITPKIDNVELEEQILRAGLQVSQTEQGIEPVRKYAPGRGVSVGLPDM